MDSFRWARVGPVTLVTGSTGFLGGHLCRALTAGGVRVRGAVRRTGVPLTNGVEPVIIPDLLERTAVRDAVQGATVVVHLAARVHVLRETSSDPVRQFWATNVEGTRVLLEEALAAGVGSFLLVSSVKAVSERAAVPLTDDTPPAPVDPYGVSKLEAERLVRVLCSAANVHAPILRLPAVYGPGMKGNVLRLLRLVDCGVPLPLGGIRNRRSMVFVGNVVSAIQTALGVASASRETFFVADHRDVSTPELVRLMGNTLGRPVRLLPLPPALLRLAGWVGDLVAHLVPWPLTSAEIERLMEPLVVDSSRFCRVTGWRRPYTVEEGLRQTAEWYRLRQRR